MAIINNVRAEFRLKVHHLKWMDDITKKKMIKKLDAIKTLLGFPEIARKPSQLDLLYEKVSNFLISKGLPHLHCFKVNSIFYILLTIY